MRCVRHPVPSRRRRSLLLRVAGITALLACAGRAGADVGPDAGATEPAVHPTLLWTMAQAVPSPEWLFRGGAVHFGARWQVTPLLYSFGINRKLSPWRSFVAEPLVRHVGSIELFGAPEYLALGGSFAKSWLFRGGLRAYFPLLHRGEYLSCSIGGSAFHVRDRGGSAYEGGLYTLFGFLGAQVTYSPAAHFRATTLSLSLRIF